MKLALLFATVALLPVCTAAAVFAADTPKTKAVAPVAAPPSNVLLFPPSIPGATPDSKGETKKFAVQAQTIIAEAIKNRMTTAGVGAYVYSRRMPSVQRAVSESLIKAENAANPTGTDDDRIPQRVAELSGADEYVVADVTDFAYDEKTHTATFSLSLIRKAVDGTPLGTTVEKAVGTAPADVAANLQQGSAVAHAAEVVADQTVNALYPMPKMETKNSKSKNKPRPMTTKKG